LPLRAGTVGDFSNTSDGVPTVSYLYFRSDLQYSIVIPRVWRF
jgi:hypothetical protein